MVITFGDIINKGTERLMASGIGDAKRDAESLLLYLLDETRTFLLLHRKDEVGATNIKAYFDLIERRSLGEPLQYITGVQEFMGLEFEVNESVLIPRQDTETLVELALSQANEKNKELHIMDMCCGSGAIAVSMAHYLPKARIVACDLSTAALEITRKNAKKNNVLDRVEIFNTDMFEVVDLDGNTPFEKKYDMILSNPPYIVTKVIETLQTEVRDHEPKMALDGGRDGLVFYRILAESAADFLEDDGVLIMEIGHDQGTTVPNILEKTGKYRDIQVYKDLPGLDRVVCCRLA